MAEKIDSFKQLRVYQAAIQALDEVYDLTAMFPKSERFRATDQILRSASSVGANIAEGWRRRRYEGAFINKLSESEGEAAETQHWLELARRRSWAPAEKIAKLDAVYESIQRQLVHMINHPQDWIIVTAT
jgi:four helix bundle protein